MNLRLICPGLLGPLTADVRDLPPTPVLDRILSRARGGPSGPRDPVETLCEAFGLVSGSDADLPSAPLCLSAVRPPADPGAVWFHADPVHLRPDRDRLLLFAGPSLAIRDDEAESLTDTFNRHFATDGLRLVKAGPSNWFLRVPEAPRLCTWSLHRVVGRPVDAYLPWGPDAKTWERWQTEAQMLFFSHPVNEERARLGRPAISGVWTWGGGVLPQVKAGPGLTVADYPLAVGLARAAGGQILGLEGWCPLADGAPAADRVLVFWDGLWWPSLEGDAAAWRQALQWLETLMGDLLRGLSAGRIRCLSLEDGEGLRFVLSRFGALRLWRRRGSLRDWIARRGGVSGRHAHQGG